MRLWSIHPKYLDTKGLVALWREGLLAKHVLENKTKGYKNHPQLKRFKEHPEPIHAINFYLCKIHEEATRRNYRFDQGKLDWSCKPCTMPVNIGQVSYEIIHLKNKLTERDPARLSQFIETVKIEVHPMFYLVEGPIENWEIL
jgi:hypothetical protein